MLSDVAIIVNPSQAIPCGFTTYLFNQPNYLQQQACEELTTFYLINKRKNRALARFHLYIQADRGVSPCRGTFGSIEADSLLPAEALDFFIKGIESFIKEKPLTQLLIKAYPFCYAPGLSATIAAALLGSGFSLLPTELNYHLTVSDKPFVSHLHSSERRRLLKCIKKGFTVNEENAPDLAHIYEMIVQTRRRRNFPVTLPFDEFGSLFIDFPQEYKVFAVRDGNTVIASAVAVLINTNILYYFLPADDYTYRSYSPMVLLINGLYDYCQQHGFAILDLGISTDKGVPNYGLMRFKQNLGADTSLKLSFIKEYSV